MATNTQRLNLVQPSVDDDIQQTIISLSRNFDILDDNYDEIISSIETHLISGLVYDSGKKYWNRIPSVGGFAGWTNIRTGVFAPKWKKQTTYSVGDKVIANVNNGHYYECIVSGTSAVIEPSLPISSGGSVYDLYGYTIWQASYNYSLDDIVISTVGDKSYYYKCIVAGTSGTTEPSWRNTAGTTNTDGSCQWYAYKTVIWEEKGISCEFIPFGTVGGYAGANTISTVGTISTGEWKAKNVAVDHGGTGASNPKDARINLGAAGKYSETIGDGTKKSFTINHNLGTQDVVVVVRETGVQANFVPSTVKAPDVNSVIVEFATAPAAGQYRVIVMG